jgi:hypothetical protein
VRVGSFWNYARDECASATRNVGNNAGDRRDSCGDSEHSSYGRTLLATHARIIANDFLAGASVEYQQGHTKSKSVSMPHASEDSNDAQGFVAESVAVN